MDFATRRVFAACMSTPSNRRLSNVSFFSGAALLFFGFCSLIFQTGQVAEVFRTICLWSVPVLLIALVVDVCRKRYWALAALVFLVASLGFLVLLIRATAQGMCCG
jgi:predicted branched-subunit amino acid permease